MIKYYCPICNCELQSSFPETGGVWLYCVNGNCPIKNETVKGFGRNKDAAFKSLDDKFGKYYRLSLGIKDTKKEKKIPEPENLIDKDKTISYE